MKEEEQNNIKQGQDEDNPVLSEPGLKTKHFIVPKESRQSMPLGKGEDNSEF